MLPQKKHHDSRYYLVVLLLLVLIGSVGGNWCLQRDEGIDSTEVALIDCHSIPVRCIVSNNMSNPKRLATDPSDCHQCFDLPLETLLETGIHARINDVASLPSPIIYLSELFVSPKSYNNLLLAAPIDWLPDSRPAVHPSVPSTVLII
ncbi:hypothetical protein [Desulfosediminicola flagellatus]|uniref:hypothetical protein n=1 Tax=Desulfosediminicola flagellatus TaxID=2569541 RepID=UPI0010AC09CD|nr:hypothetical protein [Desulfosediminicola flagellatus]